jgi:hypothetical protein
MPVNQRQVDMSYYHVGAMMVLAQIGVLCRPLPFQ